MMKHILVCFLCPTVYIIIYDYRDEYGDGADGRTDGRTLDRYITLSARSGQCNKRH